MPQLGAAYVTIKGDLKPLRKDLNTAHQSVSKTVDRMKQKLVSFGKATAKIFAFGGIAAGIASLYALERAITSVVNAASVQESAETKLAAVIKSTGAAAWTSYEQLKSMAGALQEITTTGDEVIMAGQAILLTFKQIRGEAFERTLQAALDLSEVMGQDLQTSVIMLGKALNDPVANLGALGRAGIQFTKTQKEMIKGLWESGKVLESQRIILDELESQFGGAATAAVKTFGGAMQQLSNIWGDLLEQIGYVITKNESFMQVIEDLKRVLLDAIDSVAKWTAANRELINQKVLEYWKKLKTFVVEAYNVFLKLWPAVKTTATVFAATAQAIAKAVEWGEKFMKIVTTLNVPMRVLFEFMGRGSSEKPITEKIDEIVGEFDMLKNTMQEPIKPMADFSDVRREIESTEEALRNLKNHNTAREGYGTGINYQEMRSAGYDDPLAYALARDAGTVNNNSSEYNYNINGHTQSVSDIERELNSRGHRIG